MGLKANFRNAFAVDAVYDGYKFTRIFTRTINTPFRRRRLRRIVSERRAVAYKNRPRTPKETAQAVVQLRVLRSHIDDFYEAGEKRAKSKVPLGNFPDVSILTKATQNLTTASDLDPNATLTVENKEGQFIYTQDKLAAELLYLESVAHEYHAHNIDVQASADITAQLDADMENIAAGEGSYGRSDLRRMNQRRNRISARGSAIANKNYEQALKAIDKALSYQPDNVLYLRKAAWLRRYFGQKKLAAKHLQKALQLDPENIDTIKLAQDFG